MEIYTTLPCKIPQQRHVEVTSNSDLWFHRENNTLYLPKSELLVYNTQLCTPYIESYIGFCTQKTLEPDVTYTPYTKTRVIKEDWFNPKTKRMNKSHKETVTLHRKNWNIPFIVCSTFEECADVLEGITEEIVACDIETDNLNMVDNRVLCIGIYLHELAIIINQDMCYNTDVQILLNKFFSYNYCVFHNGKFDVARLKSLLNITASVWFDTMLYHYCHFTEERGSQSLKILANRFLDAPKWEDELHEIKKEYARKNKVKISDFNYGLIDISILYPYLAMDLYATYELYKIFIAVVTTEKLCYTLLIQATKVFVDIELFGMSLDFNYMEWLSNDIDKKLKEVTINISHRIKQLVNRDVNLNSPKQMLNLFNEIILQNNLDLILTSADAENREYLQELFPTETLFELLSQYTQLKKYKSVYIDGIKTHIESDGLIHGSFNLTGTETGRLSCSNPNLQNIPRSKYIKNIITSRPNRLFVNIDASAVELRTTAVLTQDPWLLNIYKKELDLHTETAKVIYGEDIVNNPDFKEYRTRAKTVNFGTIYGISASGLAKNLKITQMEAQKLIDGFFVTKPVAKQVLREWQLMPFKQKQFETFTGRTRTFYINPQQKEHIARAAGNFPVQSTASDITLLVLLKIYDDICAYGYINDIKIIGTVHDSIMYDVSDNFEIVKWLKSMAEYHYENIPYKYLNTDLKFTCDCEVGKSWGNLKEFTEWSKNYGT